MRRPILILFAALALGAAVFAGAFLFARYVYVQHMAQSTDDLDWLRMEFDLNDAELARIRELHDGYLPKCEINCAQIAAKKRALNQAIAAGTNTPATLEASRAEVTHWRSKCQNEMLTHFEDVSRAMPPKQGARYLAEMKRLTLGEHEQVEQSMSGTNHDAHGHH
jgi:Heavy-metal resistance